MAKRMGQVIWTQKQRVGPAPRFDHAMIFDTVRQQTLLFGGATDASHLLGDTWAWDGILWSELSDFGPTPRARHAMAFDIPRGRAVLFGGDGGASDTWEWDGALWTQVAAAGPTPGGGMAMAFHPGLKQVVLSGGKAAGQRDNPTWAWDGASWTQIAEIGPSPRTDSAMTYAADANALLLIGGTGSDGLGLADTWTFDGTRWAEVTDLGPGPTTDAAIADAPGGPVLFGGAVKSADPAAGFGANAGATWRFSATKWTEVASFGPSARWRHACAFDSARGKLVLFGGSATLPQADATPPPAPSALGDTWEAPIAATSPPAAVTVANIALSALSLGAAPGSTLEAIVTLSAAGSTPVPIAVEIVSNQDQQPIDRQSVSADPIVIPPLASEGTIVITRGPTALASPGTLILGVEAPNDQPHGVTFEA